jgi:hypothetical protein
VSTKTQKKKRGALPLTLEAFISFLASQMTKIRKSQVKTLAALVFGLFRADYIGTAEIGRKMKGLVDGKHKIKRVDRFMGNKRIDILAMAGALFNMLIARLPKKSRLLVALDWTDMHDDKHMTLVLAVISCGRAIPVPWRTAAKDKLKDNQTRIEMELLSDSTIVPLDTKIVVLADRGFGKIDLFDHLKVLHFDYVIRLKGNAYIYNQFYNGSLEKLVIQAGTWRDFGTALFTAKKRYPLRLIVFYDHDQKEPWILTTNLAPKDLTAEDAVIYYSRRMEIEECGGSRKSSRLHPGGHINDGDQGLWHQACCPAIQRSGEIYRLPVLQIRDEYWEAGIAFYVSTVGISSDDQLFDFGGHSKAYYHDICLPRMAKVL